MVFIHKLMSRGNGSVAAAAVRRNYPRARMHGLAVVTYNVWHFTPTGVVVKGLFGYSVV
jgi:hypothetical protein